MLAVLPQFVVRLWNAAALGADQEPADALDRTLPLFWGYHCGHDFGPALDVPRLRLPLDFPLSVDAKGHFDAFVNAFEPEDEIPSGKTSS